MGLNKFLPENVKSYIKKRLKFPQYQYQNVFTESKIDNFHIGHFANLHDKFAKKDIHLAGDLEATRLRNYNNLKYCEFAIKNNQQGSLLSVGISYGTTAKILMNSLDEIANNKEYFLVDTFSGLGEKNYNYNTDAENVKVDLNNIKNFKPIFLIEQFSNSTLNKIKNNLIFTHLNCGDVQERLFLKEIIKKTKKNGVIIIDYYGWKDINEKRLFDEIIENNDVISIMQPTLQMILIKI